MPARYVIQKQGSGEVVTVDIAQWNPVTGVIEHDKKEMQSLLSHHLKVVNATVAEMQLRVLEAYGLREIIIELHGIPIWTKILDILEIIEGKQSADMVRRRWLSSIEETEAFEQGRIAANGKVNAEVIP